MSLRRCLAQYENSGPLVLSFDCEAGPAEVLKGSGGRLAEALDVEGLAESMLGFIRNPDARREVQALSLCKAAGRRPRVVMGMWQGVLVCIAKPVNTSELIK